MKTVIYTASTGYILGFVEGENEPRFGELEDKNYLISENALGTETNISELPAGNDKRAKRFIRGDKVSSATKTALENANDWATAKPIILSILFGD